ncbi:MAG TPA: ROK family protein [Ilumatobacteraceae bacterium]|nr:ROK family protein [Ilumatobacteraceae bacterium]
MLDPAEPLDNVAAPSGELVEPVGDVVVAVDVGATHFQAGLVTSRGVLIDRARAPIEVDIGPESQYTALALIVTEMLERAESRHSVIVRSLGLTCGGHASRGLELVSPLSVPGWRDFPLRSRLEELSGHSVYGDLDAKALALAEGWLGAAQGQPNFCAITVSAGVSGGIILDGELLDGESGYAGQIGHFIVEPGGRRCACGTQGCLEAEASGQAIDAITGRPVTEPSYQIMQRTGHLVGRTAASMCNAFDLSLVVVGGSVALGFGSTFFHAAQVSLDEHARQPYSRGARITPSRLGEQGPLVGAGAVGWRGMRRERRGASGAPRQPPNAR